MLNTVDLGRTVSKADYKRELPELRSRLLEAQRALRSAGISVLILIEGMDGSGRAEVVNRLHEWLDPRGLQTHTFWSPSDEERERPPFWRFWRVLPGSGEIAIFLGGWYREILTDAVHDKLKDASLEARLAPVMDMENMLSADRTLILKFWYQLPRAVQQQRLAKEDATPDDRWPNPKAALQGRKALQTWAERILRRTDPRRSALVHHRGRRRSLPRPFHRLHPAGSHGTSAGGTGRPPHRTAPAPRTRPAACAKRTGHGARPCRPERQRNDLEL